LIFSISFLMSARASLKLFFNFDAALPRAIRSGINLASHIWSDMLPGSLSGTSCLQSIWDTACLVYRFGMYVDGILCICRCVNALIIWWQNRPVVFFIMNKFSEC
jgi:hypothetical protein